MLTCGNGAVEAHHIGLNPSPGPLVVLGVLQHRQCPGPLARPLTRGQRRAQGRDAARHVVTAHLRQESQDVFPLPRLEASLQRNVEGNGGILTLQQVWQLFQK